MGCSKLEGWRLLVEWEIKGWRVWMIWFAVNLKPHVTEGRGLAGGEAECGLPHEPHVGMSVSQVCVIRVPFVNARASVDAIIGVVVADVVFVVDVADVVDFHIDVVVVVVDVVVAAVVDVCVDVFLVAITFLAAWVLLQRCL